MLKFLSPKGCQIPKEDAKNPRIFGTGIPIFLGYHISYDTPSTFGKSHFAHLDTFSVCISEYVICASLYNYIPVIEPEIFTVKLLLSSFFFLEKSHITSGSQDQQKSS